MVTRLVWLFLFINVYWWGNIAVYDASPRLSNNASIFYSVLKLLLAGDIVLVFLANFFFIIRIFLKFWANQIFQDLLKSWLKLPILNKCALFSFTVSIAIPNKIWVNNEINQWVRGFFIFFFLLFCFWVNFLGFIFYVNFIILIIVSYYFAIFYHVPFFHNRVNKYLFNNDLVFAKLYFNFFWGEHA